MNINDSDQPLGEQFLQNPYEYFQSFVRNMNNQVFLSEYQLNHLYALLLIRKESPWDKLKPNSQILKAEIQTMVNLKVAEVKKILESLSQMYEDKLKKNTFTQLERLMSILKARNKSIFIQKDLESDPSGIYNLKLNDAHFLLKNMLHLKSSQNQPAKNQEVNGKRESKVQKGIQGENLLQEGEKTQEKTPTPTQRQMQQEQKPEQQQSKTINNKVNFQSSHKEDIQEDQTELQVEMSNRHHSERMEQQNLTEKQPNEKQRQSGDERQVLSLFYGIANIPNLSSLALGNCLEYSAAERYIKFKMSKRYIMTIKNQDEVSFDRSSVLKDLSRDLYVHGIFPYLTAVELFKARAVNKQWMQNVKQAWHSTFKREMFVQLMACEFCKEIQFYYKLIQLRNPFFQKISLLMHALLQIIQWDKLNDSISNNTILPQLKKVLIILLKLLGENIVLPNLNSITQQLWLQHKDKILTLKQRIGHFLNNIESSGLSILDLIAVKVQLLDDPFMRVQELNSQDKTPLLLVIFIKQLTLQQILKNHIYFSQEYLMKTKNRLDNISSKMPQQKGFLEGVYKIILLRHFGGKKENKEQEQEQRTEMPNFSTILSSIFEKNEENKPDFVLSSKSTTTNIYMDKATKFDIIFSTVKKMQAFEGTAHESKQNENQVQNGSQKSQTHKLNSMIEEGSEMFEQRESETSKRFETVNTCNVMIRPQGKVVSQEENGSQTKAESSDKSIEAKQNSLKPNN